jgi:hypothetical protein
MKDYRKTLMHIVDIDVSRHFVERLYCPFTGALVLSFDAKKNRFVIPQDCASPFLLWRWEFGNRRMHFTAAGEKLVEGIKIAGGDILDKKQIVDEPGSVFAERAEIGAIHNQKQYDHWESGYSRWFHPRTDRENGDAAYEKRAAARLPLITTLESLGSLIVYTFSDIHPCPGLGFRNVRSHLAFRPPVKDTDVDFHQGLPSCRDTMEVPNARELKAWVLQNPAPVSGPIMGVSSPVTVG